MPLLSSCAAACLLAAAGADAAPPPESAVDEIVILGRRAYPADAPDRMRAFAAEHGFPFPYLLDETQMVARAYEAVCTPEFFGYDADLALRYRGRLDASRTTLGPDARRELLEAMRRIAATGEGPEEQVPSMGCSIKWRAA